MVKIKDLAPAKLNLFLDVTARRENGYHEIDSIMQSVSLCDEIEIEIEKGSGISVECSSPFAPNGRDNIVWRAADCYLSANEIEASLNIRLKKNIPSPAGMGGGSADAAAVLRCLNRHYKAMSREDMIALSLKIGSDVPFCINNGTQRVKGLGEVLEPLKGIPKTALFLIAVSGEDVPTPTAYKALDAKYNGFVDYRPTHSPKTMIEGLKNGDLTEVCKGMFNVFEEVVLPHCPKAAEAKQIIADSGALGAMMSGSGSTVFGVFDGDEERAAYAQKKLEELGVSSHIKRAF